MSELNLNKNTVDWNSYEKLQEKLARKEKFTKEEHEFFTYMYHAEEFEAYGEL
jgi:hypothetical protein